MEPYIGEIRTFAFNRIPVGWMPCEGQLLQVSGNQALYALIGSTYGGSGGVNFKLPDLRGRVMMDMGMNITNTQVYQIGNVGGTEAVALNAAQAPAHTHSVNTYSNVGNSPLAAGKAFASNPPVAVLTNEDIKSYVSSPAQGTIVPLHASSVGVVGGTAHKNIMPYTSLQVCIAVSGMFPSRP